MKAGKCQAKGGKAKNKKKKFNILERRQVKTSAQPRGKTQKTTNNKQQQEKRESRPKHVQ